MCGKCHECSAILRVVLDGEEWCPICRQYRRYRSHGWGPDGDISPCGLEIKSAIYDDYHIKAVELIIKTLGKHKCEGSCESHEGHVSHVFVSGAFGSGEFWYCEEAIREDMRRGLTVERLKK